MGMGSLEGMATLHCSMERSSRFRMRTLAGMGTLDCTMKSLALSRLRALEGMGTLMVVLHILLLGGDLLVWPPHDGLLHGLLHVPLGMQGVDSPDDLDLAVVPP